jgi:hypothetical protein
VHILTYFDKGVQYMYMNKGYIVPIILVVLLLVLAGFVVVGGPSQKVPTNEIKNTGSINTQEQEKVEDTNSITEEDSNASSTDEDTSEATSTIEDQIPTVACSSESDCAENQTCFIRPGGSEGYCY